MVYAFDWFCLLALVTINLVGFILQYDLRESVTKLNK